MPTYAHLRKVAGAVAKQRGLWAGVPIPIEGERLVVEPTYPNADLLMKIGQRAAEPQADTYPVRSTFYSTRWRIDVHILDLPGGKVGYTFTPAVHGIDKQLSTMGAAGRAWGIEQEERAMQTLRGMLEPHQWEQYFLTGSFIERSPRSDLVYMFRRLRPTAVIDTSGTGSCKVRCCLCMHPIAYYSGSWAGAMCPTDDVIAHLALMRGDEVMLWKRSNQHPPHRPEAGL